MSPRPAAFIALALGLPLLPLLLPACSSGPENVPTHGTPTVILPFASPASDAGISEDSRQSTAVAQPLLGSTLCHADGTHCYPDDAVGACNLASDAGSADAGAAMGAAPEAPAYDLTVPACRVAANDAFPVCAAAGFGLTNATCSQSAQCAAGHECVGAGSCRHYCCRGATSCQVNEFCDVQPTAQDPTILVPVCMPEVPCLLLDDDFCPESQQCSVVRGDGTTSCVNVGTAKDGESCDTEHCARGLVCIGAQGSATCAPLCVATAPTDACASSNRKCTATLPLFHTASVGVCQ